MPNQNSGHFHNDKHGVVGPKINKDVSVRYIDFHVILVPATTFTKSLIRFFQFLFFLLL